jgi:hypothetical protein
MMMMGRARKLRRLFCRLAWRVQCWFRGGCEWTTWMPTPYGPDTEWRGCWHCGKIESRAKLGSGK